MTTPYTYLLKHEPTNTFYYGCRFAEGCNLKEFWVDYKTSSKRVKQLINEYGEYVSPKNALLGVIGKAHAGRKHFKESIDKITNSLYGNKYKLGKPSNSTGNQQPRRVCVGRHKETPSSTLNQHLSYNH